MAPRTTPIGQRLAAKIAVNADTGCHEWTGARSAGGYGYIAENRDRMVRVHRLAYEMAKGPIPENLQIDHLCRNKVCCNPDHLEAVTGRENTMRGNAVSALNARKTHCLRGHEFDRVSRGQRYCLTCVRIRKQQRREQDFQ